MKMKTYSDIYDIDKKTGALIIGKNRLDDYAFKFLNKYCKEVLETPMPIPISQIIEKMELYVVEESLSENLDIFGCCLLLDSEVRVYDREKGTYFSKFYKKGTILIDPMSEEMYGSGSYRNTLMHEMIHWEKDKTFFEILELKNRKIMEEAFPIMCRRSQTLYAPPEGKRTKTAQLEWLEWQAHKLVPIILMPKHNFKVKALEFIGLKKNNCTCKNLIDDLSDFFQVSKMSAKYRLLEVGLSKVLCDFPDYKTIYEDDSMVREYTPLTLVEAYEMLQNNQNLNLWVNERRYIFVEGYFVLPSSDYIKYEKNGYQLTKKAKKNLSKCVINIQEVISKNYSNIKNEYTGYAFLLKSEGIDQRILLFHPNHQTYVKEELHPDEAYNAFMNTINSNDDEGMELEAMIGDPRKSLCNCLWFLMENRHWYYPDTFEEKTGLYKNLHGKIKNNKANNIKRDTLMAICVALQIDPRYIYKIFDNAKIVLDYYTNPDKTYMKILDTFPKISLEDFNSCLRSGNLKELGSDIR